VGLSTFVGLRILRHFTHHKEKIMKQKLTLGISIVMALLCFSLTALAAGDVQLQKEPVNNDAGERVGVKFYAISTHDYKVTAKAFIESRNNVTGDIIKERFTISSNQKLLLGTFMRIDPAQAWDVKVKMRIDPIIGEF
jgi:hypothetical protein